MNKTLKIIIALVVVLIVVLVVLKKTGKVGGEKGLEVETDLARKVTIVETVTASGKIQPEVEIKLSPEVSGEIIELNIKEGDKVKKGDLLVRINPDIYESAVKRAEAAVKSAEANVSQADAQYVEAKKAYDRSENLHKEGVIAQAEYDASLRAYDVAIHAREAARSQLESSRATLKEAKDNLKRTSISAPTDGSVSRLNVELGERVVGTAQMAGTELLRVADLANMEVLVDVNENDIVRVSPGDTAIIEVDAYLDHKFKGIVTEIANSANTVGVSADQVTNFEVKVRILRESYEDLLQDGQESPFRPGMTAAVDIRTDVATGILSVPIQAVTTRSDTADKSAISKYRRKKNEPESDSEDEDTFEVVFVYNDGKADLRVVTTGIQDDENIEIKKGVEEGEEVISGSYSVVSKKLFDQTEVRQKDPDSKE